MIDLEKLKALAKDCQIKRTAWHRVAQDKHHPDYETEASYSLFEAYENAEFRLKDCATPEVILEMVDRLEELTKADIAASWDKYPEGMGR